MSLHNVLIRKRKDSNSPLRRIRVGQGLTLENLAYKTGVSATYLSRIENGERRLNEDTIRMISSALNCDPGDLIPFNEWTVNHSQGYLRLWMNGKMQMFENKSKLVSFLANA